MNEKGIFYTIMYNMRIFPNLPLNVDKIPNSKGPGPRTKKGCDGPDTPVSGLEGCRREMKNHLRYSHTFPTNRPDRGSNPGRQCDRPEC